MTPTTPTLLPCPECQQVLCICKEPDPRRDPKPPLRQTHRARPPGLSFTEFGRALFDTVTALGVVELGTQALARPLAAARKAEWETRVTRSRAQIATLFPSLSAEDQLAVLARFPWVRDL